MLRTALRSASASGLSLFCSTKALRPAARGVASTVKRAYPVDLVDFTRSPLEIAEIVPNLNHEDEGRPVEEEQPRHEHAVISTFDLFSIGVGPSSSHTVGPMRASRIFVVDLTEMGLLEKVSTIKITLYGSLAATGKGHMTPQAILLGFEGSDPETIETSTIPGRYTGILETKSLMLGGTHRIKYDQDKDMLWHWDRVLKTHPNGMRFSAFGEDGDLLATNEYFSVGGGFVVNEQTKVDENLYYKGVDKRKVDPSRLSQTHGLDLPALEAPEGSEPSPEAATGGTGGQPPYLFHSGDSLLALTKKHNLTIAQIVYDNERHYLSPEQIREKISKMWSVMDECIRTGVTATEETLPGRLKLRRRAPSLYRRLMRGFYPAMSAPPASMPSITSPATELPSLSLPMTSQRRAALGVDNVNGARPPAIVGSYDHAVLPAPPRKTIFPAIDFLSTYAIAVNEVNAAGGRIVTSPTNGASGLIPAVLKWVVEFISEDPEQDITTFLLTSSAIGMLFKRGATISAAEGAVKQRSVWHVQWRLVRQSDVGIITVFDIWQAGFAAVMGGSPETILQAAEIGIEHNLGLTCDPIDGLVQVPCIERNSLGAVKAVTAAQLALASDGVYSVTLDEAIEAMRVTARDMSVKYKETSLSGLATSVRIPLSSPAC